MITIKINKSSHKSIEIISVLPGERKTDLAVTVNIVLEVMKKTSCWVGFALAEPSKFCH